MKNNVDCDVIEVENTHELPSDTTFHVYSGGTAKDAIMEYYKSENTWPSVVYKWAWYWYLPVPSMEDLPLFRDGGGG